MEEPKMSLSVKKFMAKKAKGTKRLEGLKKKIEELTILCDVDAFFVCFDGDDPSLSSCYSWPEDPRNCLALIEKYKNKSLLGKRKRTDENQAGFSKKAKESEEFGMGLSEKAKESGEIERVFSKEVSGNGEFDMDLCDEILEYIDQANQMGFCKKVKESEEFGMGLSEKAKESEEFRMGFSEKAKESGEFDMDLCDEILEYIDQANQMGFCKKVKKSEAFGMGFSKKAKESGELEMVLSKKVSDSEEFGMTFCNSVMGCGDVDERLRVQDILEKIDQAKMAVEERIRFLTVNRRSMVGEAEEKHEDHVEVIMSAQQLRPFLGCDYSSGLLDSIVLQSWALTSSE